MTLGLNRDHESIIRIHRKKRTKSRRARIYKLQGYENSEIPSHAEAIDFLNAALREATSLRASIGQLDIRGVKINPQDALQAKKLRRRLSILEQIHFPEYRAIIRVHDNQNKF